MDYYWNMHQGVLEEWEALKLRKEDLSIQLKMKTKLLSDARGWTKEFGQLLFVDEAARNEDALLLNSQQRRRTRIAQQANIEIQQTSFHHPAANSNQSMMINTFANFRQPQQLYPLYQHQARPSGPPVQMTNFQQPQQRFYYGSQNATSH